MRETRRNKNREDDRETQNERGTKTLVRQRRERWRDKGEEKRRGRDREARLSKKDAEK